MTTVTIPQKLTKKGDLIVIPKNEYELFTRWKKAIRIHFEDEWFWTPEWQKKEAEADAAIKTGKVFGPFFNYKSLIAALKKKR